jgi:uncharacterized protein DUF541
MAHRPRRASALAPELSEPAVDGREAEPEPPGQGRCAAFAALVGEQNPFAEVRRVRPSHRHLPHDRRPNARHPLRCLPTSAQPAIMLRAEGPAAAGMRELVGVLQSRGLTLQNLSWRLTRDMARAAREEAARLALDGLQRRAATVTQQLGLAVARPREVRLDAPERDIAGSRMAAMGAYAEAAGVSLVSAPDEAVVSATLAAVLVLAASPAGR